MATAEAVLTADGWTFGRFCGGPYVAATEQALAQAESLGTPYQPRLLSVPELYMLTLWLHHDLTSDGAQGLPAPGDLLVPLAPAPPGIAAHRPQRIADLLPGSPCGSPPPRCSPNPPDPAAGTAPCTAPAAPPERAPRPRPATGRSAVLTHAA